MMSCFSHAADPLPADPKNPSSICAAAPPPNPSIFPGFCFEFRPFERDYMGVGLCDVQQELLADHKNIPLITIQKCPAILLAHTSAARRPDLCGSHLKLAPPSHGADDRQRDANGGRTIGEEEFSASNIGWPPISSFRRSTTRGLSIKPPCSTETMTPLIVHEAPLQVDAPPTRDGETNIECAGDDRENDAFTITACMHSSLMRRVPLHIKVSMDGNPIMRKLDLKTMQGYHHLSLELHKLFKFYKSSLSCQVGVHSCFKDLSGDSFLLTYKDRDGDWMLVGDTPWETFAHSAIRIRIMKKK